MGSSHSTRRRTGNQLSSAGFFHSAYGAKVDGDSSVCNGTNGKSFVLPRISKRSKVSRSSSEKFAAATGQRTAINRVASVNGWTKSAQERAAAVTGDIVDKSLIHGEAKSTFSSVPLLAQTVAGPYQPCGVDGWRMIDEDNINMANNDRSGCESLLESCDVSDPTHEHSESGAFAAQASALHVATCSTIDLPLQNVSLTTVPVSGVVNRHDGGHNYDNFSSKSWSQDVTKAVLESADNDAFSQERQDDTLQLLHSDDQQKSIKPCSLTKTCNADAHSGETAVSDACSCKLSYMRHAKPDELTLENKQLYVMKESSVNSAVSQDSGRASSVGVNSVSHQVAAVNGFHNLCTSMCSLASDDLMLETEAEIVSSPGCDSYQSSFDIDRIIQGLPAGSNPSTQATVRSLSFSYPLAACQNKQSGDFGDGPKIMTVKDGMQKQTSCDSPGTSVPKLPFLSQHCPVDSGDTKLRDHQNGGQAVPTHLRPPRRSVDEPTVCALDGLTYRRVMQDITQFKTSLLKLKRLLQDDDPRSILKLGSEYTSCSSPFSVTSMNGYGLDGSTPTTPTSNFSFTGVLVDEVQHNSPLFDLLQENADLKRQLACLQQVAQQQKATIVHLQQEMMKHRCERVNVVEVKTPVS